MCLWHWATAAWALDTVSLQFKWSHAFQFAGYYAALEKSYYRDAGLEVILRAGGPGSDPLAAVLSGQAQYGVGTSSLLLARQAEQPVVVLAVVFQHSPLVLVVRRDSVAHASGNIQTIHDIVGKRVMIEPQSDELIAYLRQEGILPEHLQQLPHSTDPQDLIDGRVEAMSAYVTNEPFYLDRAGIPYQTFTPRTGGIDFYGDNLFTTEQELKLHPERVRAFRAASLRGWQYAMAHPEEIADLILAKYSQQHPRDFYLFEAAQMVPLLRTDLIEVGYMTRGRWRHIANTYAGLGLLPADFSLDGFLYEPNAPRDRTGLYLALGLLAALGAIAFILLSLRRRLAVALADQQRTAAQLAELSLVDPLTQVPSRRLLQERLGRVLAGLRRDSGHAALLVLIPLAPVRHDVVVHQINTVAREVDTIAQLNGTAIAVLLGGLAHDEVEASAQAGRVAARLCAAVGESVVPAGDPIVFDNTADGEDVLRRADSRAKRAGEVSSSVNPAGA